MPADPAVLGQIFSAARDLRTLVDWIHDPRDRPSWFDVDGPFREARRRLAEARAKLDPDPDLERRIGRVSGAAEMIEDRFYSRPASVWPTDDYGDLRGELQEAVADLLPL
jgi:hypothetical protein